MKTAQYLENLYRVGLKLHSGNNAKDFVSTIVFNVLADIQEENFEVT
jgi:hypothetical protein